MVRIHPAVPANQLIQFLDSSRSSARYAACLKFEKCPSGALYLNAKGGAGSDAPLVILLYHAERGIQRLQPFG